MTLRFLSPIHRLALLGAIFLSAGCSPSLSSPAAHAFHFASPASNGAGRTTFTAGVGAGGEAFGPGIASAEAQVRRGVADFVDLGASATAAVVVGDDLADPPHRGIYGLRAFTHYNVVPRWLALHVGVGGGASAAGGYFAPDLGLTLGYENEYVVPYLYGSVLGSVPVTKPTLDVRLADDTNEDLRRAYATVGSHFGAGLRVPVGPRESPVGSIFVEASTLMLAGDDPFDDDGFGAERFVMMGAFAYEHRFGAVAPAP